MLVKTKELSSQQSPKLSSEINCLSEKQKRGIERGKLFISCLKDVITEDVRKNVNEINEVRT
jgi:hypothetical protein